MTRYVTGVECLGDCRLLLTFEGNERREVDIALLVSLDGVFEARNDVDCFRRVRIEPDVGTVV